MSPEDKTKLQDAWRKAVAKSPDADKPIPGWYMTSGTDEPATQRKLMEAALTDEDTYKGIDQVLAATPGLTIDELVEKSFGPKKPKGPKL